jgi:aminomethyltransferase
MVTLEVDGDAVPEYGAAVTRNGEPVGTLTSPCESPTLARVIGLAVLDTGHAAPGTSVEVALGDGTAGATVSSLPIYDPEKRRPRQ